MNLFSYICLTLARLRMQKRLDLYLIPTLLVAATFFIFPTSILAEPLGQGTPIPSSASPSRAAEETAARPSIPSAEPEFGRALETAHPKYALSPEAAKLQFTIKGIRIINPVVFCEEELLEPYLCRFGKKITLEQLQKIATEMTTRYSKAGYVLTQVLVPQQKIVDGVVTFQVLTGYIDQVEVSGDIQPCVADLLMKYGCAIKQCIPLHTKTLERYALLANDIPGMKVKAMLKPSKKKQGASNLVFVACQELENGTFSVNNFASPYLGPLQFIATGSQNSWFYAGDETQGQFVTTGDKKLNYGQLRYGRPIGCDGLRFNMMTRYVISRPSGALEPLQIRGFNKVYAFDFAYPFIRSREENLYGMIGFTYLNDTVNVLNTLLYNDRVRPVNFGFQYNRVDCLEGINSLQMNFTQGLQILNASGFTYLSRPYGKVDFSKLNWTYLRVQPLPCEFSLATMFTGQNSYHPLLSSMQFGFGGSNLGRGYDPSEILGDNGMAAIIELRYDVRYFAFLDCYVNQAQYYIFTDTGQVWNLNPNPPPQTQQAASAGLGLRVNLMKCLDANFFYAKPLTKPVNSTGKYHWRGYFSLTWTL
jgi:hemolysin activation/secretion protein